MKHALRHTFILGLLLAVSLYAQEVGIVPRPASMTPMPGSFTLDSNTVVALRGEGPMPGGVAVLLDMLRAGTGLPLPVAESKGMKVGPSVILLMLNTHPSLDSDERYTLEIGPNRIAVRAFKWKGIQYALQSLRQLLPPSIEKKNGSGALNIPCVRIDDGPRFPWRGMHLDVGRHLFPVDFIKKYIDLLAMFKLNVFHWHLTEDQGWRIEIRKYPKLTSVGSKREETMGDGKPYGGFYTQEEVRVVVDYATQRGITVVPEIELPGHSVAALTAYPELSCTGGPFTVRTTWGVSEDVYCAGNEKTFAFLEDVLGEVMELFPSQFIHIGGDECPKARWKACPKCRQRIADEKLKNEEELQSWFIRRIERFVNSKGRRIIGWDEILEGGLAPNAAVMSWRGIDGGIAAAKAKHDVVMSPTSHCYFDYAQGRAGEPTKAGGFIPLERVYGYEPVPDVLNAEEAKHILGAQGNVWTEWMPDSRIVEYMALPRMAALAEVVWSPREGKSFADFTRRMEQVYARLTLLGVNFRVPSPDGLAQRMIVYGDTAIALRSQIRNAVIRYETGGADPTAASPEYTAPIGFTGDGTLAARLFLPDGRMSPVSRGSILRIERGKNGVVAKYFEGRFEKLPNMKTLKPLKSEVVDDLDHLLVRRRPEHYAISFTGDIALPADGEYTFTTVTDDGSIFFIDGKQLINDDGLHSRHERSASGRFTKGRHPFELRYLQAGGDSAMEVWISGPGIPKQLLPPRMLYPAAGK